MAKTVLVTGSSTGIGRATALHFHQRGWNVAATMRSPHKETEFGNMENVAVIPLDVDNAGSICAAMAATVERFDTLDVLVNNAGYGLFGLFEEETDQNIRAQIETNLFGVINTIRAALPHMRRQRSGTVVNVTSMAAIMGVPLNAYYCLTKFAIEGLTETLAAELAPFGIRFKSVQPGMTTTEFHGKWDYERLRIPDYDGYREAMIAKVSPNEHSGEGGSSAQQMAEVIYAAATDPGTTVRYPGGEDAQTIANLRRSLGDADFFSAIWPQFTIDFKPGPYRG